MRSFVAGCALCLIAACQPAAPTAPSESPPAATVADQKTPSPAGPFRVVTREETRADIPPFRPGDHLPSYVETYLRWMLSPAFKRETPWPRILPFQLEGLEAQWVDAAVLELSMMQPDADIRFAVAISKQSPDISALTNLAVEGHVWARAILANFAISGGAPGAAPPTAAEVEGAYATLREVAPPYALLRPTLAQALFKKGDPASQAEGVKVLMEGVTIGTEQDFESFIRTLSSMPPEAGGEPFIRQMLEAIVAQPPTIYSDGEISPPYLGDHPIKLALMLEEGKGGPKDVKRAAEFYTLYLNSRAKDDAGEAQALAALKRLGVAYQPKPPATPAARHQ